jgi:hypothetical protein
MQTRTELTENFDLSSSKEIDRMSIAVICASVGMAGLAVAFACMISSLLNEGKFMQWLVLNYYWWGPSVIVVSVAVKYFQYERQIWYWCVRVKTKMRWLLRK